MAPLARSVPPIEKAFVYLCRTGAVTAWLLQVQLGMPETTFPRVFKQLRALEVVEPVI